MVEEEKSIPSLVNKISIGSNKWKHLMEKGGRLLRSWTEMDLINNSLISKNTSNTIRMHILEILKSKSCFNIRSTIAYH